MAALNRQKRLILAGATVILALAGVVCVGMCYYSLRFTSTVAGTARKSAALAEIYHVRSAIYEAASYSLRYFITRNPDFRQEFEVNRGEIDRALGALDLVLVDPAQRARLGALREHYRVVRAVWDRTIDMPFEQQRKSVLDPAYVRHRDTFNELLDELAAAEHRAIARSQYELAATNATVLACGLLNVMLTVAVTSFVVGTVWQEFRKQENMLAFTDQLARTYGNAKAEEATHADGP